MIERGDPLFALKEDRPVLRTSKHVLFVKMLKITIERTDPLFALSKRLIHVSLVKIRT